MSLKAQKIFVVVFAFVVGWFVAELVKDAHSSPSGHGTLWYTVPSNVTEIRVRSFKNGKKVMDRTLSVEPGQTFRIDPE